VLTGPAKEVDMATKSVRIDEDVFDAAAAEASRSHRSIAEQVNYWAAVGRRVTSATGVDQRRIDLVVSGRAPFSGLTAEERLIAHARIDTAVEQRSASVSFGELARLDGVTTVTLDDGGNLVQTAPDGTITRL
jgi:hypothetical protein